MTGNTSSASQPVAFDGHCAFGVGLMGASAPAGKPAHALQVDGKTYLFSGGLQKAIARMFPGVLRRAERKWDGIRH